LLFHSFQETVATVRWIPGCGSAFEAKPGREGRCSAARPVWPEAGSSTSFPRRSLDLTVTVFHVIPVLPVGKRSRGCHCRMLPYLVTGSRTGREKISLIAMFAAFVSKVLSSGRREPDVSGWVDGEAAQLPRAFLAPFLVEAWPRSRACSRLLQCSSDPIPCTPQQLQPCLPDDAVSAGRRIRRSD
jgi:hypothetical protein